MPPAPVVRADPLTVKDEAPDRNSTPSTDHAASMLGVVRTEPPNRVVPVPLLGNALPPQFAEVDQRSFAPPPFHVNGVAWIRLMQATDIKSIVPLMLAYCLNMHPHISLAFSGVEYQFSGRNDFSLFFRSW